MRIISKYEDGGGFNPLPFVDYMPFSGLQGNYDLSDNSQKKSDDSDEKSDIGIKEILNLVKELDGLPIDILATANDLKMLYNRAVISPDGKLSTGQAVNIYLSTLLKIGIAKFNKEQFTKIRDGVISRDGIDEAAIDRYGRIYVQNPETGEMSAINVQEYLENRDQYNLITNSNLLNYRATNPSCKFNNNILEVVANGIGSAEITKMIHTAIQDVESSTTEGYTSSATTEIAEGLTILKNAAKKGVLDKDYLYKLKVSDNGDLITSALNYLWQVMPQNARTWLALQSGNSENPYQGAKDLLIEYAFSKHKSVVEATPAKNPSNSGDGSSKSPKTNFFIEMQKEEGAMTRPFYIITSGGDEGMRVDSSWYPQIMTPDGSASEDMSIDRLIYGHNMGNLFNTDGVCIGDQHIKSEDLKDIMYDHTKGAAVVTLPCKKDFNNQKVVDVAAADRFKEIKEKLDKEVEGKSLSKDQYDKILGDRLKEAHLYNLIDYNTGRINWDNFGQFLAVNVYTTDKIEFDKDSKFIQKVKNPDKLLEDRLIQGLSLPEEKKKTKNQNLYEIDVKDKWGIFEFRYNDVYRATMFIPMTQNTNAANNAWGTDMTMNQARQNENLYQQYLKMQLYNGSSSSLIE